MRSMLRLAMATTAALMLASPASAQRRVELGLDGGAVFGLGDQSSINITIPGSRFRVGFFQPGSRVSIEPAAGFAYNKVKGVDGVFTYDLQLGALYHFNPIIVTTADQSSIVSRLNSPYVRPFVGLTGFSGGNASDNEVSIGAGLGTKVMWRRDLALRFEGNLGYGFDNKAARIGLLAGLSYFPR